MNLFSDSVETPDRWRDPDAYPHHVEGPIELHETHISRVYLAGKYAYKVKKPIVNAFLDYGTLEKRHHACCEELRLGQRYAQGLYLDVVPIARENGELRIDGEACPIEFAVRMRRFADGNLLSDRLKTYSVTGDDMRQLAVQLARVHDQAERLAGGHTEVAQALGQRARENFEVVAQVADLDCRKIVSQLSDWSNQTLATLQDQMLNRLQQGWFRECHGDLHCDNIVYWNEEWVPFDGIEFNPELAWIDVLNDLAFLVMDLHARGRADLAHCLLNAYLEQTGDYAGLHLLRWYLVYRAMVRAKVALLREQQVHQDSELHRSMLDEASVYIQLANRLRNLEPNPCLWITHGVSGSGKSTGARQLVASRGMIQIRSDVERKRLFKKRRQKIAAETSDQSMYASTATEATYAVMEGLARTVLDAGYSVIIDATFLQRQQRDAFHALADSVHAEFRIVHFEADHETLIERIRQRAAQAEDASDANAKVLEMQRKTEEPLSPLEETWVQAWEPSRGEVTNPASGT